MYSLNEDWLYSFLTPKNYHQPHINYEKSENSESEFFEFKNSQDSENSENAKSPKTPKSPKIPIGTMKSPNPSQNWTPTRSFKSEWTPSELWIEFRKFYMLPKLFWESERNHNRSFRTPNRSVLTLNWTLKIKNKFSSNSFGLWKVLLGLLK